MALVISEDAAKKPVEEKGLGVVTRQALSALRPVKF